MPVDFAGKLDKLMFDEKTDKPEAAALMRVEILDEEEKTGPTLGRVLGA